MACMSFQVLNIQTKTKRKRKKTKKTLELEFVRSLIFLPINFLLLLLLDIFPTFDSMSCVFLWLSLRKQFKILGSVPFFSIISVWLEAQRQEKAALLNHRSVCPTSLSLTLSHWEIWWPQFKEFYFISCKIGLHKRRLEYHRNVPEGILYTHTHIFITFTSMNRSTRRIVKEKTNNLK